MSDATIVALITGVPATLLALGTLIVGIRNSAKADVIVGHVNSAATKAAGEIAALRQEIELMRGVAADKKETAALLAQARARPPEASGPPGPPGPPSPAPSASPAALEAPAAQLTEIAKNTAATAKNTEKGEVP